MTAQNGDSTPGKDAAIPAEELRLNSDGADDVGQIPAEILEKMPEPVQRQIRELYGVFSSGPAQNPLTKKITEHHITAIIENESRESEHAYNFRKNGRWFTLAYVLIGIAAFFGLAWFFGSTDPELFKQILTYLGTFVGGFAAGWGFTAARGGNED